MYGEKIKEYIEGFDNGAKGERENLTKDIAKKIDDNYDQSKKNNFWWGSLQSFVGTILWVALTIFVGLYNKYGNGNESSCRNQSEVNAQQSIIDTISTGNDTTKYIINNQ